MLPEPDSLARECLSQSGMQNLQSESDSRHASLQASCAAITDLLEQFKRKHLAEAEDLKRRLFDIGQTNSQLSAQGLQEATELRDLSAQLTELLRKTEHRYRESASKQQLGCEGVRATLQEEVSQLKQQLELAQRAEVETSRNHASIVTDLTFERGSANQQLELLQRRFDQLTHSNRRLVESATVAFRDDDLRVATLNVALGVVQKQLVETSANLGKAQSELLEERLKHRTTGLELSQARSEVATFHAIRDDNQRWAGKVQSLTADLSRAQMESVNKESLLSELRAQLQRSQGEVESLQSRFVPLDRIPIRLLRFYSLSVLP
jgi:hypothetical protein